MAAEHRIVIESFKALRAEIENVVSSLEHRAPSCFQLIAEEVQGLREWLDASQCLQRGQCGTRSAMATMPSQPQIASAHLKQALKQECDKLIHGDLLHIRILGYIDAFKSETQVFLMRMLMAIKTPEIHDFHGTVWARFHLLRLLDKYRELKRAHLKTRNRRQRATSALDELVRYIYRNDEQSSSPNAAKHRRMRRALQARLAHGRKWGLIRDRLSLKAVASISANRNKGEGVSVVMNTEIHRTSNDVLEAFINLQKQSPLHQIDGSDHGDIQEVYDSIQIVHDAWISESLGHLTFIGTLVP